MSRFTTVCSAAIVFACAGVAQAHVTATANCANCHTPEAARATINATKTTNTANNPGVAAGLPLFVAHPGDTIALPIKVTNGGATGDSYGVAVTGFKSATTIAGVLNANNTLTFTPDATWAARTTGGAHATLGAFSWAGVAANYSYALNINASTPVDYYKLTLTATGSDYSIDPNNPDMWTQQQDVLVQVTAVPEPASLAAMGMAAGALVLGRRRTACHD